MSEEDRKEEGDKEEGDKKDGQQEGGREEDGATWWRLTFTVDGQSFWSRYILNKGEPAVREALESRISAEFDRGVSPSFWRSSYPSRKCFRIDYLVDWEEVAAEEVVSMLRSGGG